MDLLPTSEQEAIMEAASTFVAEQFPTEAIRQRRGEPAAVDERLWGQCAQLGWFGLGVGEEAGGVGYTPAEQALLFRELGRGLATGPHLSTVLGARIAETARASEALAAMLEGRASVGLAQRREGLPSDEGDGQGTVLDLIDAVGAEYVLLLEGETAHLLPAASLLDRASENALDSGTRLETATLEDADSAAIASTDAGDIRSLGTLLVSAMLTGIAEAARDLSVEHAKSRVQFGRPIGVHQAIKHECADMATRATAARAQLFYAAASLAERAEDHEFQVRVARVVARDAAVKNAEHSIQVHGGMGYTFEHDVHLYVRRARTLERVLEEPTATLAGVIAGEAA